MTPPSDARQPLGAYTPGTNSRPLLDLVLEKFPDTPRKRAKEWIVAGRVSVAGKTERKPNQMFPADHGRLELQGRGLAPLVPDEEWRIHPRLSLIHLDASLAIVNKGAGLLSVPAPITDVSALSILNDFLAGKLRGLGPRTTVRRLPPAIQQLRPLPVHRLDQFTTGVLCLALNPAARTALAEQFAAHTASRQYVAFIDGRPRSPRGTWRHWLRFDDNALRQQVFTQPGSPDALESVTHYEVIEEFILGKTGHVISKMRFKLETGRTHQIRAQAAQEGLPLVGDRTYHPLYHPSQRDHAVIPIPCERQALHAETLELTHPVSNQRQQWSAPIPADLQELERALRGRRSGKGER
jgi:23S rRNA pseudouridine1911/1915/1917 synthase